MKLQQLQEDKSPEDIARAMRRYEYLAGNRIASKFNPKVRSYREFDDNGKVALSVCFQHAPWLSTFRNHFMDNSDLPDDLKPRAQEAVEVFAEKFAEKHGIPYTKIKANYQLVRITYYYQ